MGGPGIATIALIALFQLPYTGFQHPERVTIANYPGDAMEPFLTHDGRFLLFNNRNDPQVDTNLHYAERVDGLHFAYRGEIQGVNTSALEAVPSVSCSGDLYFVSTRSYPETFSTIYRARFAEGTAVGIELVPGISRRMGSGSVCLWGRMASCAPIANRRKLAVVYDLRWAD